MLLHPELASHVPGACTASLRTDDISNRCTRTSALEGRQRLGCSVQRDRLKRHRPPSASQHGQGVTQAAKSEAEEECLHAAGHQGPGRVVRTSCGVSRDVLLTTGRTAFFGVSAGSVWGSAQGETRTQSLQESENCYKAHREGGGSALRGFSRGVPSSRLYLS